LTTDEFGSALQDWLTRFDRAGAHGDPEVIEAELQTAVEELRVADEELRTQRAEVARLLADRQSRAAWHERLVTSSPVPIVTTDDSGIVTEANVAACRLFGRTPVSMVRKPLSSLVAAGDRRRVRDLVSDLRRAGGQPLPFAVNLKLGDNETAAAQIVANYDSSVGPHIRWVVVPASTQRMVQEGKSAVSSERAFAAQVAQAFSRLWQIPLHLGDQRGILTSITDICHLAFPDLTWASINLGSPVEPAMVASNSDEAQHLDGLQVQAGEGPCEDAWRLQTPVVTGDLCDDERWPRFIDLAKDIGVRSVLAVPILLGTDKIGALNLYQEAVRLRRGRGAHRRVVRLGDCRRLA